MEELLLDLRKIVLENNQMLRRICNYLDKVESPEYRDMEDKRAFNVNVAADIYVDKLKELKNDILDREY